MAALSVVVLDEPIQVGLDLFGVLVPGGPACDAEALVEKRPVHALGESVCSGRAHLGCAVLDSFESGEQFVGV